MKETKFREGFTSLGNGLAEIAYSCWIWLIDHKLIAALVVSLAFNIILCAKLGKARAERDNRDSLAYVMEQKADSLKIIIDR